MATIAEKSRTKEIIDRLQSILNNASPVPLAAGKVTIYKDEVQSLLDELAMQVEAELKTYHEVNDRRGKLLNEAKKEAERIIYEAEHSASRMRVSKRSTNAAPLDYSSLEEEEIFALSNANEIYAASLIYTDEMLTEVSKVIEDAYQNIRSDYEIVLQVFEEKMSTILSNKDELMMGLQEMDTEDRSQQILEIGQLLSNELYNERMKRQFASDQYDDGSVQLSLDLQVEKAEENARAAEEMAKQTAEALEQMKAERDALMETVMQMEKEQILAGQTRGNAGRTAVGITGGRVTEYSEEEDVEYEIVYVTEDELEEGEEYEIEYVDEEEYEAALLAHRKKEAAAGQTEGKPAEKRTASGSEQGKNAKEAEETFVQKQNEKTTAKVPEQEKTATGGMPLIPHFKSSEKIASAPSGQIAKMATAVTTEQKYSGLIGRAVANREKEQAAVMVEEEDTIMTGQSGMAGKEQSVAVSKESPAKSSQQSGAARQPETEPAQQSEVTKPKNGKAQQPDGEAKQQKPASSYDNSRKKQRGTKREKNGQSKAAEGSHKSSGTNKGQMTTEGDKKNKKQAEGVPQRDEDIKTDANGGQYVQATMKLEDNFEIVEF